MLLTTLIDNTEMDPSPTADGRCVVAEGQLLIMQFDPRGVRASCAAGTGVGKGNDDWRGECDDLRRSVLDFQVEVLTRRIIGDGEYFLLVVVVQAEIDGIALAERREGRCADRCNH